MRDIYAEMTTLAMAAKQIADVGKDILEEDHPMGMVYQRRLLEVHRMLAVLVEEKMEEIKRIQSIIDEDDEDIDAMIDEDPFEGVEVPDWV